MHFLLKIRVLRKLFAIDNCLESLFSPTECHWLYQPQSRVAPVPRRSWPTQNRFHGFLLVYLCVLFWSVCHIGFLFFLSLVLIFICCLCVVYIFWGFLCKRERIWDWVGRDVEKIWEELGEEKNIIKINCMKTIFTWPPMKVVIFYALSANLSLAVSRLECMVWV